MSTAQDSNPPTDNIDYKFYLLSDLDTQVVVQVEHLLGTLPGLRNRRYADDVDDIRPHVVYVTAGLFADERLLGLEVFTPLVETSLHSENGALASWNEKLEFAAKYRDLPFETQLAVTVWHFTEKEGTPKPLGGATMRMFSKKGRLKTGQQKLMLWEGRKADMSFPTETPGKKPAASRGEIGRLEKLCKRYERGEMKKIEWLDTLTFKELDRVFAEHLAEVTKKGNMLILDLPIFKRDVVFHEVIRG